MAADGSVIIDILGDDSGFAKAVNGLKSVAGKAVKGIAAGAAAATAAVGALAKSSLDSYAAYEQLVGGVETLFKDSAGLVQQYAASAYKTAGVSANTYMEQATAFSASLVQSLGGDTKAAAEYANQAIMDMSDNANKMGTDIESIQATYQSLMRGNYAMLDNLKLGYGGTKKELERLVADAEKLTGQALDPSKFSDIITAIHAVQENLGITGTTAKEASTTIEGSVNAMKAAWSNWLTGLGNADADMDTLTDRLIESISGVADNIYPAVERIGKAIVENLPDALSGLGEALRPILEQALVSGWNLAVQAFATVGITLPTIDTTTIQAMFNGISTALQTLKNNADWLVPSLAAVAGGIAAFHAASSIVGVVQGIQAAFTTWRAATEGMTIAQAALNAIMNANPFVLIATVIGTVVAAFVTLMATNEEFRDAVIDAWNQIVSTAEEVWGKVVEFFTVTVPDAIQSMLEWFEQLPSRIREFLSNALSRVGEWAGSMAERAAEAGSNFVSSVIDFFAQLPSRVGSFLSDVISRITEWATDMIEKAKQTASDFKENLISGLETAIDRVKEVGRNIIEGLWKGIGDAKDWLIGKIQNLCTDALGAIKDFFGIHSPSRVMRDQIGLMIARGMALGIKKGEREVLSVAYRLNDKLLDAEQELNDKLSALEQEERDRRAAVELADHQRKIKEKYAELGKTEKSERQKIQDEIAKLEADWNEKQLQAQYDAEKEKLQAQIDTMKKFRDEYEKALDEIQDAQNDMAGKLADYGELFKSVEKNGREFFELGDLQKDIDAINRYGDALENLKARGVSDSLLDEITSMGVEEATAYTERLLGMTDEQYAKYMALWEQKQAAAKQVASQFYRDEMDALGKEFVDKIPEELGEVKDEMRDIGVMGIQGMIDGMYSKSGALWNAAASIVSQAIAAMRRAADIHSPSRKTAELVGVPFVQGVGVGFEKAYPGVMERMRTAFDASMAQTSAQLQSAAGGHGSSVTREVNNNTTTVDRILRIEVTGEDGEFVRWLRNKIKTEDDRVGPALA